MESPANLKQLELENKALRARLGKSEETLHAIRSGKVDALFVLGSGGRDHLLTLKGSDMYRVLIEEMCEGALTMTVEGVILYANSSFAEMINMPLEKVIGTMIQTFITPESKATFQVLMRNSVTKKRRTELELLDSSGKRVQVYVSVDNLLVDEMLNVFCMVATDVTLIKKQQQLEQLQSNLSETMQAIAHIVEMRDPYTAGHQVRVANLATAIARQMLLSDEQVLAIHLAGSVHDLGKIKIPAEILSKPGRISDAEFNLIKEHAQAGYDILKSITFSWPIAQMVLQHHERLDGSGYPQGLKGDAILLEARILSVADVIEAMASHRPYRLGLGIDKALEEITKLRGKQFDIQVVDACLMLFREHNYSFKG